MNRSDTDRPLTGILCMLGFCVLAPLMDACAKATPAEIPAAEIVLGRFGIQVLALVPVAIAMGHSLRCTSQEALSHLLRALALLSATVLFFTAVREMPIANAIAIFFVEPFILTLLSAVILKESIGPRRIIACIIGFGGALLIIRPSFSELGLVALFPLGTAFFFALYMVLTRMMSGKGHPVVMQAQTAIAATLVLLPVLLLADGSGISYLDPVMPTGKAIYTLLGVGFFATVSHIFITYALKFAPAATIAPLQYLEIVSATAVGYAIFGDMPDSLTFLGIAIIVGSGLYVFAREQAQGQRIIRRRPPPAP